MTENKGSVENETMENTPGQNGNDEEIILENEEQSENEKLKDLVEKLEGKQKECEEYLDLARRTKAEFENFRRRTQKEKESLYEDGFSEAIKNLLPVLDNLERAVEFNALEKNSFSEGVEMVLKIFRDTLGRMGVEGIEDVGQKFDPDFHNAVMHVQDESLEENVIVEVLQKGYKYKNKVIRHSMVKVAN